MLRGTLIAPIDLLLPTFEFASLAAMLSDAHADCHHYEQDC
jgi:hypothetical protein